MKLCVQICRNDNGPWFRYEDETEAPLSQEEITEMEKSFNLMMITWVSPNWEERDL